jgi:hypothetical protein
MAFYVPLGSRGVIFRLGTVLTGVVGGFLYWQSARRRAFRTPILTVAPIPDDAPPVL